MREVERIADKMLSLLSLDRYCAGVYSIEEDDNEYLLVLTNDGGGTTRDLSAEFLFNPQKVIAELHAALIEQLGVPEYDVVNLPHLALWDANDK